PHDVDGFDRLARHAFGRQDAGRAGRLDGRRAERGRRSAVLARLRDVVDVEGISLGRAGLDLDLFAESGKARVGDDVRYVEKRGLVETDVDERCLHPGKDPDHPALVDVAYDPFLVLALQVVLRNGPLLDQRDPGLLTRGVDHQDVRHRRILVRGSPARARRTLADAPGWKRTRARKRCLKRGRPTVPASSVGARPCAKRTSRPGAPGSGAAAYRSMRIGRLPSRSRTMLASARLAKDASGSAASGAPSGRSTR